MDKRVLYAGVSGCVLMIALAAAGLRAGQMDAVDRAVCDLDGQFQKRFATVQDAFFGARRIPSTPEHGEFESLKPATSVEKSAVARLRSAGRDALFMVAGARARAAQRYAVLAAAKGRGPGPAAASLELFEGRVISRPIVLTGRKPRAPFPSERSLLPEVARAFDVFRTGNRYQFRSGEWAFTARPVPAGKQACLKCHPQNGDGKKMQVGDPIGVALYGVAAR